MCDCKVCQDHREFETKLAALPEELRPYFVGLFERFNDLQMDHAYAGALIDGSWPDADKIIGYKRQRVAEAKTKRADAAVRCAERQEGQV